MANKKQMGLLSVRAKEAGIEWVYQDGKEMTDEEIDAKLAEFAEFAAKKGPVQETVQETVVVEKPQIDKVRFGLACKCVLQKMPHFDVVNETKFTDQVKTVYQLMESAEKAI